MAGSVVHITASCEITTVWSGPRKEGRGPYRAAEVVEKSKSRSRNTIDMN